MSSDRPVPSTVSARALASRRNGARSRGPKTAAGKARSARNALKHGLCASRLLVLAEEDAGQFAALSAALQGELAPAGAVQLVLAQRVVSATWRLARADRMEAEVLDFRRYHQANLGLALIRDSNGPKTVETVRRYRSAALTELMRALTTLQTLQARAAATAEPPAPPARRRGPHPGAMRNEPRKARRINGLIETPPLDPRPDPRHRPAPVPPPGVPDPDRLVPPPTTPPAAKRTREVPAAPALDPPAPRRAPHLAADAEQPTTSLQAPRLPLAATRPAGASMPATSGSAAP